MIMRENTDWFTDPGTTYFYINRTGDEAIYANFCEGDIGMFYGKVWDKWEEDLGDLYSILECFDSVYRSVAFKGLYR